MIEEIVFNVSPRIERMITNDLIGASVVAVNVDANYRIISIELQKPTMVQEVKLYVDIDERDGLPTLGYTTQRMV